MSNMVQSDMFAFGCLVGFVASSICLFVFNFIEYKKECAAARRKYENCDAVNVSTVGQLKKILCSLPDDMAIRSLFTNPDGREDSTSGFIVVVDEHDDGILCLFVGTLDYYTENNIYYI